MNYNLYTELSTLNMTHPYTDNIITTHATIDHLINTLCDKSGELNILFVNTRSFRSKLDKIELIIHTHTYSKLTSKY